MFTKMTLDAALLTPGLEHRWSSALEGTANLYAMYHSVPWLRCMQSAGGRDLSLLVDGVGDEGARLIVAPMVRQRVPLRFEAGRKVRFSVNLEVQELLGSQMVGEHGFGEFSRMVEAAWTQYPEVDGLYLKSVSNDSALWAQLASEGWRIGRAAIYKPDGDRPFHYVRMPATFDEYLAGFSAKRRFNLKRQVRRMTEAFDGDLVVRRVVDPTDVAFLVESATTVSMRSWRSKELERAVPDSIENVALLRSIAENGMLRAFVLIARGRPCAFIVGYQFGNSTFHYADLAFDEEFASHSPGTVLLLKAIESLIQNDQVANLNFGITDAQYKQVLGNRHVQDAALLILRPGVSNALFRNIHRGFRDAKRYARQFMRRRSKASVEE